MDHRGLYKFAARCALGYSVVWLASYAAWISGSGFMAVTASLPSTDRLVQLAQAPGNQLSARLDIISYFLLIPALLGIFAYLRERASGRAYLGAAFAGLGLMALFGASTINATAMTLGQGPVTDLLRSRLELLYLLSFSCMMPGLYALAALNLVWGLALRKESGQARLVGTLFLAQIAAFAVATGGFIAASDLVGNSGILLQVLAGIATYAWAGWWLRGLAEQEPATTAPTTVQKPKVAGASG
jgi:hypothetical protein